MEKGIVRRSNIMKIGKTEINKVRDKSSERRGDKRKDTDANRNFRKMFRSVFKDTTGVSYSFRKKRIRTVNGTAKVYCGDVVRLRRIRKSLRTNNKRVWKRFFEYLIIKKWSKSKLASINNIIGFMENEMLLKDFFINENTCEKGVGSSFKDWDFEDKDFDINDNPEEK